MTAIFKLPVLLLLLVNVTLSTESKTDYQSFNLNLILGALKNINTSSACGLHIKEYLNGLTSEKLWAQMSMY